MVPPPGEGSRPEPGVSASGSWARRSGRRSPYGATDPASRSLSRLKAGCEGQPARERLPRATCSGVRSMSERESITGRYSSWLAKQSPRSRWTTTIPPCGVAEHQSRAARAGPNRLTRRVGTFGPVVVARFGEDCPVSVAAGRCPVRIRFLAVVAATLTLLLGTGTAALAAPATASGACGPAYYLSLGDSLAQGVQPTSSGVSVVTDQGYVDDLYAAYRRQVPGLQLVKLGCPGESTDTMIRGRACPSYPSRASSQLAAAADFLAAHRGRIALVTLDIGANDVDGCVSAAGVDNACVAGGIAAAGTNLPVILGALQATDRGVRVVGMNYYDPFLALWRQGSAGQVLATDSVGLTNTFNGVLEKAYTASGVPVADVSTAFLTNTFLMRPVVNLPLNVATICVLTWMCAPAPVGGNIHPRPLGYLVIAGTFVTKVGSLRRRSVFPQ